MKHTAAFIAARDALAGLIARPELLDHATDPAAVLSALDLLDRAGCEVVQGDALDLPAPPDADLFNVLPAARDALDTYAARELPAWGSAECAQLLAALGYASQVLDVLGILHTLGAEAPGTGTPSAVPEVKA